MFVRACHPPSVNAEAVRNAAEGHVTAIAERRIDDAASYVVEELRAESRANLLALADTVTHAEVREVAIDGDEAIVLIRLRTSDPVQPEISLKALWWEIDGRPVLVQGQQVEPN